MIKLLDDCKYFKIVINALHDCFDELGIPNIIVDTIERTDKSLYLICTTHQILYFPPNYISYNFEQLITDKEWSPTFFNNLKNAKMIWDYSLENIKVLNKNNLDAIHLPFGYNKTMEPIKVDIDKTIDYCFIGCLNQLRLNKMKDLIDVYYKSQDKLYISNDCWNGQLEDIYNKTKIGLNIHFYNGKSILEVHRIILMIVNKVNVLSETSNDKWYDDIYKNMITFIDLKSNKYDLVKKGMNILKKSKIDQDTQLDNKYNYLIENCLYLNYIKTANIINLLNF